MNILALETSCDETSAAVLSDGNLLSNIIFSQIQMHRPYRGIVPEIASRAHVEKINIVLEQALKQAFGSTYNKQPLTRWIDAIAVTVGPGLVGSLLIGKMTAQALAWRWNIPVLGINHLEAHLLSSLYGQKQLQAPFLGLIVSGGHTDLVAVKNIGNYQILGRTRDDAAGECFDKVASLLDLPYPGGPEISRLAKRGNAKAINFPRALIADSFDFSFSGLKTAALYYVQKQKAAGKKIPLADFCASFQEAVVDSLVIKTMQCAKKLNYSALALGGGVSCNYLLQQKFLEYGKAEKMQIFFPQKEWTTDNAAMIALAANYQFEYLQQGGRLARAQGLTLNPSLELASWYDQQN